MSLKELTQMIPPLFSGVDSILIYIGASNFGMTQILFNFFLKPRPTLHGINGKILVEPEKRRKIELLMGF